MIVKSDEQGVQTLNSMADSVEQGVDEVIKSADEMKDEVDEYPALGPHREDIINLVESIKDEIQSASAPAAQVAEKLREKADELNEWISDSIGGSGN